MTKPVVDFSHVDGNIFAVLGTVRQALRRAGMFDEAQQVSNRVLASGSYDEALRICFEYVDVSIAKEEWEDVDEEEGLITDEEEWEEDDDEE